MSKPACARGNAACGLISRPTPRELTLVDRLPEAGPLLGGEDRPAWPAPAGTQIQIFPTVDAAVFVAVEAFTQLIGILAPAQQYVGHYPLEIETRLARHELTHDIDLVTAIARPARAALDERSPGCSRA